MLPELQLMDQPAACNAGQDWPSHEVLYLLQYYYLSSWPRQLDGDTNVPTNQDYSLRLLAWNI